MSGLEALRGFARRRGRERCELCACDLQGAHQHLLEPEKRKLVCSCDGCAVLFDERGATRLKRVPRQVRWLRGFDLPDPAWKELQIPISLGFVYRSSVAGSMVAAYPSPAGVTESSIDPEPWRRVAEAHPALAELREDVEALLVNRIKERREYYLAPIDRCFELVGIVRTNWKGMSGGDRVWSEVDRFLASLRESAVA